ncbi:MAG: M23 family metallopeptidase [Oscillospiraceae bacterium]|nr:M23 family metallopeptidase [Oscillospiraceae bacterium]
MSFKIGNLSGKGLIIAVGACILAVGAAGFYSYTKISDQLNAELIGNNSGTLSADAGTENKSQNTPVNAEQTDIAKSEETTTAPVTKAEEQTESAAVTAEAEEEPAEETNNVPQAMVRPLNGEVLNGFSDGELVKSRTLNVWRTHDGVDIAGAQDEKVKSMTSGTVTQVYDDQMWGACVVIDHGNGLEGYYCGLNKEDIPVAEGQAVSAGTVIGSVGNTAESEIGEDSHLHFAVKKNGDWIDPVALISGEGS